MEVGGPPWLEGAAVRAGYATVSATTAVAIAWGVAWSGRPLLHAAAWPLFGLMLVTVGRAVWRDTQQDEGTTVAVAVETMMIVIGVAAAVMAATGAWARPWSAPERPSATSVPSVLDAEVRPTSTVGRGLIVGPRARAGAAVAAAIAQLAAAGAEPTATSTVPDTTTTSAATTRHRARTGDRGGTRRRVPVTTARCLRRCVSRPPPGRRSSARRRRSAGPRRRPCPLITVAPTAPSTTTPRAAADDAGAHDGRPHHGAPDDAGYPRPRPRPTTTAPA